MIENSDKYQYSHVHYEAKQYIEDLVEESMCLYTWFEHKLERDTKSRVFSENIESSLNANQDMRLPVTMALKIVSEELVKRACPPHDHKAICNLSNIILFVTSNVITRLTRRIADVNFEAINFDLVKGDLLQLIVLMVIQFEFDKKEHTEDTATTSFHKMSLRDESVKEMKNEYSKLNLVERIDYLLQQWTAATLAPLDFYKKFHAILLESESGDDDGRAHQILYLNDVFFQDNTSYLSASTLKKFVIDTFMSKLYTDKTDLDMKFDELFKSLLLEDIHLASIFKSRLSSDPISSKSVELDVASFSYDSDTTEVGSPSGISNSSRIVNNLDAFNPFAAQKSSKLITDSNDFNTKTAPSIKDKSDHVELVHLNNSKDSKERSEKLPEASDEKLSFFAFWYQESFTLKVIRWIDWKKTGGSIIVGMSKSSISYLNYFCDTCKYLFYTGPCNLFRDICSGTIFTSSYWYNQFMKTMHQLPPTVANTFLHWGNTQTTQILIHPFFTALVAGIVSFRFFTCAVHIGSPNFNYNKGVIVLVILIPFLWLSTPKTPTDFRNWYPVLLPMSAMVLGGFLTLATCEDSLDATTYLGLPERYDLTDTPQSIIIPIVYGIMHAALALFGLLPITMCRRSMKTIMEIKYVGETLASLLGIHDFYFNHRMIGYLLMSFILIGGILWWLVLHHSCTKNDSTAARACTAFYPEGNYFDIRGAPWFCESPSETSRFRNIWLNYDQCVVQQNGNGQAVLFLRELVVLLLVLIITTSEFKYPTLINLPPSKDAPPQYYDENIYTSCMAKTLNDFIKFKYKFLLFFHNIYVAIYKAVIEPNEFEVFIYTHIVATYILAIAAMFSRFEVFYGAGVCWAWYFLDKLYIILFCTHRFRFSREDSELFEGAMKIVLVKRHGLPWKSSAGEICYLQCPKIGQVWLGRQWHPFSLAYSNSNDVKAYNDSIEFLMQVQRKNSWTHSLKELLFEDMYALTKPVTFHVRGPFGSSFDGYRNNEVLMLIGGGSGIASSLSSLRELCAFRGNVKKCWFIFVTRNFSSVQWTWNAINEVLHPKDSSLHSASGFIRISIHVSARLTAAQENFVKHNGALKYIYRPGRPDWKKLFRSFGAQSIGVSGPKRVKICACANKAIYADINRALVECNNANLTPEFSSENFE